MPARLGMEHQDQHVLWVGATAEEAKRIKSLIVEATNRLRKHNDWVLQQLDAAK